MRGIKLILRNLTLASSSRLGASVQELAEIEINGSTLIGVECIEGCLTRLHKADESDEFRIREFAIPVTTHTHTHNENTSTYVLAYTL